MLNLPPVCWAGGGAYVVVQLVVRSLDDPSSNSIENWNIKTEHHPRRKHFNTNGPETQHIQKAFVPLWRQLISWVLILMQIVMKYGHNFIVLSKQTRFHLFKDRISMRKSPFRFTRQLHFPIWLQYRFRRGSEAAPTEPSRDRVGTASGTCWPQKGPL